MLPAILVWHRIKEQTLLSAVLLLLSSTTFTLSQDASTAIPRSAIQGKSVSLACGLPVSSPAKVRWMDLVYNSDPSPKLIFNSINNPEFSIAVHPNQENYAVDKNFTLTISDCKLDMDPGQYLCYSEVDGKENVKVYQLTIGEMLQCSASASSVGVDTDVELDCKSSFSGDNHPQLKWTATDQSGGEPKDIPSEDRFEIKLSRHMAKITTTPQDDGRTYTCHMKFGDQSDECSIVMNVTYRVQKAVFTSAGRSMYHAGEVLKCSADGNPKPTVTLSLAGVYDQPLDQTRGAGWSSIVIPESWVSNKVSITCAASNIVNEVKTDVESEVTFVVAKKITTVAPPQLMTTPAAAAVQASSSMGIIVGLIIAAVVILAVIVAVYCVRKRKQQKKKRAAENNAQAGAKLMSNNEMIYHPGSGRA